MSQSRPTSETASDPFEGPDTLSGDGGEFFSFIRGGPFYRALSAIGLSPRGLTSSTILAAVLVALCMVPLVLLTAIDGTLYGRHMAMPLSRDMATLGRLLVSLPVLVLLGPDNDLLARRALAHFYHSGLVKPDTRPAFMRTVLNVLRLRDATLPELLLLLLAFIPAFMTLGAHSPVLPIEGWHFTSARTPSLAGLWLDFVAKPLWLFMVLWWVWRLVLWALLLYRLCQLDLSLHAAHPDGAGGLGFLAGMQQRFSKFTFAVGVVLAGAAANDVLYLGATLNDIGWILLTYIVSATLLMCLPLVALTPRLVALKRQGMLAYGALGTAYLRAFEAKWLVDGAQITAPAAREDEVALDQLGGEYGTLTDLNAAYQIVQGLSIVPINKYVFAGIALPAILPMLPVALLALGAPELLKQLLALLG